MHDLGIKHALLLQGPAGPFMKRFAADLRDAGIQVTKVNFHAGDVLFYSGPDTVAFRGRFDDWPDFVRELMIARGIDGLFVFGDCRPMHRSALEIAESIGVAPYALEEGYLRPDWITCEKFGVNGHSRMPRDPEFFLGLDLPDLPPPKKVGQRMAYMSWYSTFLALTFTHLNQGFPHYAHHRNLNAWYHTFVWLRNLVRKEVYAKREEHMLPRFENELSGRYFFVPLQVHCDFQLRHSPYENVLEHVDEVVETFASVAPADAHLVFKHHPMDRAYVDYTLLFQKIARDSGLGDRLHYCHDLHLPTLIRNSLGVITINSTVGLQSIGYGTPTHVMGTAVYDMPGLTFEGTLEDFLTGARPRPDREIYMAFRRYLLHTNQINGTFYKRVPGGTPYAGLRWFPGLPEDR